MFSIYQRRQVCGLGESYSRSQRKRTWSLQRPLWPLRPSGGCGLVSRVGAFPGSRVSWSLEVLAVTPTVASAPGLQSSHSCLAAGSGTHHRA